MKYFTCQSCREKKKPCKLIIPVGKEDEKGTLEHPILCPYENKNLAHWIPINEETFFQLFIEA